LILGVNVLNNGERVDVEEEVKGIFQDFNFKFPVYMATRLGTDTILRGRWPTGPNKGKAAAKKDEQNYSLVFWDRMMVCEEVKDCPLRPCTYHNCTFKSGFRRGHRWCLVQKTYLKSVIAAGLRYIERTGNDFDKILVLGFHLLPLYNVLFQHKFEMLRLNRDGGWTRDPEDSSRVHPVFAEFRKTLNCIDRVWARLGQKRKGGFKSAPPTLKEEYMDRLLGKSRIAKSRRTKTPSKKVSREGTGMVFK
jgi:hypothetical protein